MNELMIKIISIWSVGFIYTMGLINGSAPKMNGILSLAAAIIWPLILFLAIAGHANKAIKKARRFLCRP